MEEDLRYPVGRFDPAAPLPEQERAAYIDSIAATPARLRAAVAGLSDQQLDTPYRDGGWTVRQLVHHIPDSHMNAYVRLKLALTEETPTIKTYEEARWAELPDTAATPIDVSLAMLELLHTRWVTLLRALGPEDFSRALRHPEIGAMTVASLIRMYEWHGRHHVAHINRLRDRMNW